MTDDIQEQRAVKKGDAARILNAAAARGEFCDSCGCFRLRTAGLTASPLSKRCMRSGAGGTSRAQRGLSCQSAKGTRAAGAGSRDSRNGAGGWRARRSRSASCWPAGPLSVRRGARSGTRNGSGRARWRPTFRPVWTSGPTRTLEIRSVEPRSIGPRGAKVRHETFRCREAGGSGGSWTLCNTSGVGARRQSPCCCGPTRIRTLAIQRAVRHCTGPAE